MSGQLEEVRTECAARLVALVDAIRSIPDELAPCSRAKVVAIREQIYYGWERPLAQALGARCLAGKYEVDGWWSVKAAELANSEGFHPGTRQLEREHVEPIAPLIHDLLATRRSAMETADLLDQRIITCTVLAAEHRLLPKGDGWDRYAIAGVEVQRGLSPTGQG